MIKALNHSESLISNLSREAQSIRLRAQSIGYSKLNCKNENLLIRLENELKTLQNRRYEILRIARFLQIRKGNNNLSIELLIEICQRPVLSSHPVK